LNIGISRESCFEERLLTAILDDFDQLTAPAATPRPAKRLSTGTALIAAAAAAGIAAASLAGFGGHAPRHSSAPAAQALTSPKVRTAAYVVKHMDAALNANTAVLNIISHEPDSQTGKPVTDETWSTSLSNTSRSEELSPTGQPVTGSLLTITAHRTVSTTINYRNRTWRTVTYPFGSATSARTPAPLPQTPLQQAARLRAQVKTGQVTMTGRVTVDGQAAIHLTEHLAGGLINLWVSPTSYLPIREIDTAPGVPLTSDKAIRYDYRWLPATAANLRLITAAAAIPAGFTQVSPDNGR
jgi:hypothetical protein